MCLGEHERVQQPLDNNEEQLDDGYNCCSVDYGCVVFCLSELLVFAFMLCLVYYPEVFDP